jgi:hydroxypyruvate isomerase
VPRFSANLGFLFPEHAFLDRFAAAARAGFEAVEFPDPYSHPLAEIAARLQDHRLTCALFNLPLGDRARGERGLGCLPDRVAEFRAGVALAADTARALGCQRVNCMAGNAPPGADPAALRATLVDNVRFAARQLRATGITLCIEALSTGECPGFYLTGSQQAAALIAEVGEDNVAFQLDLYHMQIMEGGLPATIARVLPLVGHVQFADVPGRQEPGTGQIDFPPLFALLDQLGYRGWVGAEYRPSRRTEDTLGWLRSPRAGGP